MRALLPVVLAVLECVYAGRLACADEAERTTPAPPVAPLSLLKQIDAGFVEIYDRMAPAVVVIEAERKVEAPDAEGVKSFEFFLEEKGMRNGDKAPPWRLPVQPARSEGSGFFIRPEGTILTNLHVVADAEKLTVRMKDGRILPAKLLAADDKTDIAVLKVEAKDAPVVEFGDSDALRVGQLVCAIGTPYNQDFSFTCGWVSGKGRNNLLAPVSAGILYEDYIQTDAFINPGNSGGPLFDVDGKVIGMNTLINGIGRGLAFAIPSNILQQISAGLIANGKIVRPWLGVRIESLAENPLLREHASGLDRGVVVDTIEANAPAYKSELRPADIITEVDGNKVGTAHDLQKEVLKKRVGQAVQLTIWRAGQMLHIPVLTGELPEEMPKAAVMEPKRPASADSNEEGFGMKLKQIKGGVQVTEVVPESPAGLAELQAGDLIVDVEGKPISTTTDCLATIRAAGEGANQKGVLLDIERKGRRTYAVINAAKP